ncbi:hypothetical protein B0T26DRAFT_806689 [Lasiosphaeria miniovina]|uniref:DUF6570 domain-containing protein n=1 Tax=Lasiosphaeria miniovina TaxID=1954250 RepID=A0AA40A0I2_9PEZI|nr:uncharacterized protein B0T26DRAFT_806689 [Lasiosphaeria miniovina]KAK0707071.1 hypothetical protein B0T26DRAFT_806689 [Lasiosphaeria miniovina]
MKKVEVLNPTRVATEARYERAGDPDFFSTENKMDLGNIPDELPELTQVEEQLIARVHVYIDVRLIRAQQYRFSKHYVSFLRDTGSLFDQLPRLPRELDIIILRPRTGGAPNAAHTLRAFRGDFRVRRRYIEIWLQYLIAHHPGYADLEINAERLSSLPVDAEVTDDVTIIDIDEEPPVVPPRDDEEEDDNVDNAAAPNLLPADSDISRLRQRFGLAGDEQAPEQPPILNQLEIPRVRRTPISDFNKSVALISLAMPTLMPQALGEFTQQRQREVKWGE